MQSMDNSNTSTVESNILDITHWQESPEQAHTSLDQKVLPLDELDSNGGHQHTLSNDSNFFLDTSHDTFGAGTSWLMDPEIGHRIMSPPDIKSEPSLLLEQSADLTPGQVHFMHHRPSNSSLYTTDSTGTGDEHGTTFSHSTASLVHNPQVSYVVSPAESPRLTPFAHAALHGNVTAENFSRRGSTSSELANNFNGIHLQRVSSQQTSEDEVFKTPLMPPSSLNLAARRKRQRPPALVPQRTASANIPPLSSPGLDIGVPQSVRRVKSSNNSLNVIGSRVSKSGVSSAQRSPLNIASFGEAAALERLRSTVVQASNQNEAAPQLNIDPNYGDAEPTSMPDNFDLPIQTQSPTDYMSHWHHQTTSPADSLIAPPLSASFTQKSYDEGSLRNSPPVTPFTLQNPYMNQFAVPQSAPAHILSFPEFSSPAGTQPTTPSHFYAPQPQYPGAPFLVPGQGVHQPMFSHGSVPNLYDVEHHQPRISRSYSSSGQFNFFAAPPPPPQKELEVVMTEFPRPPGQKGPLLKLPQNFTFQNSGPKDYATE